jgi:hypothetical protein
MKNLGAFAAPRGFAWQIPEGPQTGLAAAIFLPPSGKMDFRFNPSRGRRQTTGNPDGRGKQITHEPRNSPAPRHCEEQRFKQLVFYLRFGYSSVGKERKGKKNLFSPCLLLSRSSIFFNGMAFL